MDIKELFERIASGEVAAHSELGTRDEAKQSKTYAGRLRKLKIATGIKAHALVMKDVVIPFNPFTCEPDSRYNSKVPFRPILLVSQVLEGIKAGCAANSELATKWNKVLGTEEIDWAAPVSMADYFIFKKRDFIKPRIMSFPTVSLNFGGVGGFSEFKQKYTVDPTELNENNSYDPETAPVWHRIATLEYSILKPEVDEAVAKLEKAGATKEQIAAQKRAIYAKAHISFVSPTNLVPFLYFPFNEVPKNFDSTKYTDFESCIRWASKIDEKWGPSIQEAFADNTYDENMDFFDLTIKTPTSKDVKSNGQVYTDEDYLELYTAMTITCTDSRFSIWSGTTSADNKQYQNKELYKQVWEAASAYFLYSQQESAKEGGDTFEKIMSASNNFRPMSAAMPKFLPAIWELFTRDFASSPYFTESLRKANADVLTMMNPDNALAMAAYDEEELDEAKQKQAVSVSSLMSEVLQSVEEDGEDFNIEVADMKVDK